MPPPPGEREKHIFTWRRFSSKRLSSLLIINNNNKQYYWLSHLSNVYSWVQAVANIHHYGRTQVLQSKHKIYIQLSINNNKISHDSFRLDKFLCKLPQLVSNTQKKRLWLRGLVTHLQDGIISKERCNKYIILFIRVNEWQGFYY